MSSRTFISAMMALALFAVPATAQERKNVTLLGIPSATTAPGGVAFVSLSGTNERSPGNSDLDGSLAFGLGVGNANDGIGFQFTTFITSLTDNLGDSGYLAVKASTRIAAGTMPTYLGLSLEQLGNWGDADDVDPRANLSLTSFALPELQGSTYPVMFTLGVGTNVRNNREDPGVYLGAGMGLTSATGISAAWTGETVSLGASFRSPDLENFGITAVVEDAFDQEDSRRLALSLNWAFRNLFGE